MNLLQSFLLILVHQNKYYLQVYLDNCAYRIAEKQMADYLNEVLDPAKNNHGFKFQHSVCNGCHDLQCCMC